MDWRIFEAHARDTMSKYFGTPLVEKNPKGFPKRFDLVSWDESIIGDAKYLTLVNGVDYPPAKIMEITGHVWLLEKVKAKNRFLIFGNSSDVPKKWLEKYGNYKIGIDFYFLDEKGSLTKIG